MRKISAQSLLPLLHFSAYVTEIKEALATFTRKAKDQSLKQNEAHGLIVRVNVFLEAYFKYRHIAVDQELQAAQFVQDEKEILGALGLEQFARYSKVTWALYLKTVRFTLRKCTHLHAGDLSLIAEDYGD